MSDDGAREGAERRRPPQSTGRDGARTGATRDDARKVAGAGTDGAPAGAAREGARTGAAHDGPRQGASKDATGPGGRVSGHVGLRWGSLRLRLALVFGAVALTAAVSASGIAYWINREAVLTRTQDSTLNDFRQQMQNRAADLPVRPSAGDLRTAADQVASDGNAFDVLLIATGKDGRQISAASDPGAFTLADVPATLRSAVAEKQKVTSANRFPYHLFWQRVDHDGTPYLVGGAHIGGGALTGYMFKSLAQERADLDSLAWSLGIAAALALVGAALIAQAAARTVLKPVQRLGEAARKLGEGKFETRLRVSGTDELADLSRTFNNAAASLQKQIEDMSAREESSRRFVADMSHELRTPLTALTAVTEVLEEEVDSLDPMIAPAVTLVVSETRRLGDLVENLMEVTRFDAGTARLVLDSVDVADQVTACLDARAWLDAVELDAERGIIARLDPRRLDVILANLIGNALKHGGAGVRVSVRTEPAQTTETGRGELVIVVRDHGPGIPEDVLPHVFDRFYKASASRPRSDGSGLGLSIAMENARIHQGTITASNMPGGGGAQFVLRLPRGGPAVPGGEDENDTDGPERRDEGDDGLEPGGDEGRER